MMRADNDSIHRDFYINITFATLISVLKMIQVVIHSIHKFRNISIERRPVLYEMRILSCNNDNCLLDFEELCGLNAYDGTY